jgi:hypothetical protein
MMPEYIVITLIKALIDVFDDKAALGVLSSSSLQSPSAQSETPRHDSIGLDEERELSHMFKKMKI